MLLNQILIDIYKNKWIIKNRLGSGGFGEIYTIENYNNTNSTYAVKIEPSDNGSLFVEMHFYIRNCKKEKLDKWKLENNISHLGISEYISHGIQIINNKTYRFIIMKKFSHNLSNELFTTKIFINNNIYKIAIQIINSLKYFHSLNYIHCDIKAENILYDETFDKIYLIDYGLVTKTKTQKDTKLCNNGTLIFMSRDMHYGIPTKRSDLEMLLYNMIYWLTGSLPWINFTKKNMLLYKEKAFTNIKNFINNLFLDYKYPKHIENYMLELVNLNIHDNIINHDKFIHILIKTD